MLSRVFIGLEAHLIKFIQIIPENNESHVMTVHRDNDDVDSFGISTKRYNANEMHETEVFLREAW